MELLCESSERGFELGRGESVIVFFSWAMTVLKHAGSPIYHTVFVASEQYVVALLWVKWGSRIVLVWIRENAVLNQLLPLRRRLGYNGILYIGKQHAQEGSKERSNVSTPICVKATGILDTDEITIRCDLRTNNTVVSHIIHQLRLTTFANVISNARKVAIALWWRWLFNGTTHNRRTGWKHALLTIGKPVDAMLSVTNDSELFLLGPETVPILKPLSLLLKSHASIVCRKISLHKTRDSTGVECLVAPLLDGKHGTTTCTIVRSGSARLSDAHCARYSMQHRSIEKKRGKNWHPIIHSELQKPQNHIEGFAW